MNRDQLLQDVNVAWGQFQQAIHDMSPETMERPTAIGPWSVKDTLAHIATWDQEAVEWLGLARQDKPKPDYNDSDTDAFNQRDVEQKRSLPLAQVLALVQQAHAQIEAVLLHQLTDDDFAGEPSLAENLYGGWGDHYREHSEEIAAYRQRQNP